MIQYHKWNTWWMDPKEHPGMTQWLRALLYSLKALSPQTGHSRITPFHKHTPSTSLRVHSCYWRINDLSPFILQDDTLLMILDSCRQPWVSWYHLWMQLYNLATGLTTCSCAQAQVWEFHASSPWAQNQRGRTQSLLLKPGSAKQQHGIPWEQNGNADSQVQQTST